MIITGTLHQIVLPQADGSTLTAHYIGQEITNNILAIFHGQLMADDGPIARL